jgi:hypothetical protein
MKPLHALILIDLAGLMVCLKLIFGNLSLFAKAVTVQFFANEYPAPAVFARWEKKHDTRFKMSLLYWCGITIAAISFFSYILLIHPQQ